MALLAVWLVAMPALCAAEESPSGSEETISVGGGGKKKKKPRKPPAPDAAPATGESQPSAEAPAGSTAAPKREMMSSGVTEVTVTAQKRKQKAQEVPISMGVLNEQFIQDSGLTDVRNLQEYVPNLQIQPVTDSRSTAIRIRGIGTPGNNAGFDPSVGTFVDGVYLGRPGMSLSDLLDIERVEVLRGPQGTLYGKNTAAGAINVISKKPEFDYSGILEGVYGNYNAFEGRGSVNVPLLQDRIAARLSAYSVTRDGFDGNPETGERFNNADKYGFKLRTLFKITDALEWLVTADYAYEDTACCAPDLIATNPWPSLDVRFRDLERVTGKRFRPVDGMDRHIYSDRATSNKVKASGIVSELNWDVGDHVLTNVTAYRIFDSDSGFDGDFSQYDAIFQQTRERYKQASTELRLASPSDQTLEYVVGLFGFYGDDETRSTTGILNDWLTTSSLGPLLRPDPSIRSVANTDDNVHKTYSAAAFGQGTYKFSEQWSVTAGVRVMWERKTRVGTQESALKLPVGIFGPDIFADQERERWNVSPMLGLRYFPTVDKMLFVSGARGFKSGGFNQLRVQGGAETEFDDEEATNFEAGAKTQWFNRRLTANATFFYTLFDNFQAQAFDGSAFSVLNAGSLTSYGVEADFVEVPHPTLVFGQSVGFNKATYDEFTGAQCTARQIFGSRANPQAPNTCTQDLSGERLDNAPEWSISAWAQWEREIPSLPVLGFLRGEWSYRDRVFLQQDLDPGLIQDPVNILNLRAGIRDPDDRWQVTVWTENVTNSTYYVAGVDVPLHNGWAGVLAPPRTYGLQVRLRF